MGLTDLNELGAKQIKTANTLNLIGGIVQGLGGLADTINGIYQMSKGRTPIPIGAPLQGIGNTIGAFGANKQAQGQKNAALGAVNSMANLGDNEKQLLMGAINAGETGTGFKGAFDVLAADRAQPGKDLRDYIALQGLKLKETEVGNNTDLKRKEATDKLRDEYFKNTIVKDTQDATIGINKIRKAANSFETTGSGFDDMSLIFNFMKVLDPGSTVREGEYNTAAKNASLLERIGVSFQKVANGEQLSPTQRKNLLEAAERQYSGVLEAHDIYKSQFNDMIQKRGVDPNDVFLNFGQGAPKATEKIISKDPVAAPPAGAIKIKGSDGNLYWGDPKTKTVFGRVQ